MRTVRARGEACEHLGSVQGFCTTRVAPCRHHLACLESRLACVQDLISSVGANWAFTNIFDNRCMKEIC
jgi:hypothetical protein